MEFNELELDILYDLLIEREMSFCNIYNTEYRKTIKILRKRISKERIKNFTEN